MNKRLVALAVAALIAGCGGGSDNSNTAQTPQAAIAALMSAKMPLAVSATAAAEQLFAAAEVAYPQYFPSHQTTQSLSPFVFRYYPETGIYLGVVVTASAVYNLNHVYVAGGPFGTLASPTDMGALTNFITPVDTGGGGGTASACYDLSLADTQGTHSVINYTYSGTITGTELVDSTVGGLTTFEGNQARETTAVTTGTHTVSGQTVSVNTTGKYYIKRTGDAEVTTYGGITTATGSASGLNFTTTLRSVFSPPYVDTQYSLAIGGSVTLSQVGTVTSTTSFTGSPFPIPDQVTSSPLSGSTTIKYVGQESVTVPAGTYNTCKLETTSGGSTSTSWLIVGKGLPVKITSTGQTIQATSITLNGAAL